MLENAIEQIIEHDFKLGEQIKEQIFSKIDSALKNHPCADLSHYHNNYQQFIEFNFKDNEFYQGVQKSYDDYQDPATSLKGEEIFGSVDNLLFKIYKACDDGKSTNLKTIKAFLEFKKILSNNLKKYINLNISEVKQIEFNDDLRLYVALKFLNKIHSEKVSPKFKKIGKDDNKVYTGTDASYAINFLNQEYSFNELYDIKRLDYFKEHNESKEARDDFIRKNIHLLNVFGIQKDNKTGKYDQKN